MGNRKGQAVLSDLNFNLSERFLSLDEQQVFSRYLEGMKLDHGIWEVFSSLFRSGLKHTRPLLLRLYEGQTLSGAIVLVRCTHYGKALFRKNIPARLINLAGIPYLQWIRFGCCMDMMSNPGFFKDPDRTDDMIRAAMSFLKEHALLTIITDYSENERLFEGAVALKALPHAFIDCSGFDHIDAYLSTFKNIRRKLKVFKNKGGTYDLVRRNLNDRQVQDLERCFTSTAERSVFYLPYQELYLRSAKNTSRSPIDNAVYFIATLNGNFIGYQAALVTGQYLNALHGAFDRTLKTTFHAYDILFVKMTEFAIENGLEVCDFGAVLNHTKQKMVNRTVAMSYFVLSRYTLIQKLFGAFLKMTRIQGTEQLKFTNDISN
jgi:predicted N-acyltransferase